MIRKTKLTEFQFCTQDAPKPRAVTVPHTWNVDDGLENYVGSARYSAEIDVPSPAWKTVLRFQAVYHTCTVFLNGKKAGEHRGSGYTPFLIDVTPFVQAGRNHLEVLCENTYTEQSLPHKKDFDWACDGGILRPVEWMEYDENCARSCRITSTVLEFLQDDRCRAEVSCDICLWENEPKPYRLQVTDALGETVHTQEGTLDGKTLCFTLENTALWSPEHPALYTLRLSVGEEEQSYRFGVRKIETRGDKIYLNDRPLKLIGVEWMPGSNPKYGMAEPISEQEKFLSMLKDLNCNFTRFHWQQSDFTLDWCDEHGILVQEEIPYWGSPKAAGELQTEIAKRQADDMLEFHYNHPSIVCWGVGNELGGHKKATIAYVREMYRYFKAGDPMRLVNYVSNTMAHPRMLFSGEVNADATAVGDICMWNEYLGTWMPSKNYERDMRRALLRAEGKPLVITEFGLCEPAHKGGDPRRIEIYKEKTALYEKLDFAGWVYFCLNDYRTHIGESGSGKYKQRIHGSVDLEGAKKPSYAFVKAQNARWQTKQKEEKA